MNTTGHGITPMLITKPAAVNSLPPINSPRIACARKIPASTKNTRSRRVGSYCGCSDSTNNSLRCEQVMGEHEFPQLRPAAGQVVEAARTDAREQRRDLAARMMTTIVVLALAEARERVGLEHL